MINRITQGLIDRPSCGSGGCADCFAASFRSRRNFDLFTPMNPLSRFDFPIAHIPKGKGGRLDQTFDHPAHDVYSTCRRGVLPDILTLAATPSMPPENNRAFRFWG